MAGVADAVRSRGIACFGPGREAARLEGSKAFAKEVMAAAGVPTALAHVCTTAEQVADALDALGAPYVVKDDGLAAGKGVVVTDDRDEALAHATRCLEAGSQVVVEEFLDGPEVSLFCLSDGEHVVPLAPAQDFKRVGDGDTGPNTGGMGAYSPLDWAPGRPRRRGGRTRRPADGGRDAPPRHAVHRRAVRRAGPHLPRSAGDRVQRPLRRPRDPGRPRPPPLARWASCCGPRPWAAWTRSGRCAGARTTPSRWSSPPPGYPGSPRTGGVVEGLAEVADAGVEVMHAGTAFGPDGTVVSAGGRVLSVVALGADLGQARERAYAALDAIALEGGAAPHGHRARGLPRTRSPCRGSAPADGAWRHHRPRAAAAKLSP